MTALHPIRFDPEALLDAVPTPNAAVREERRGGTLVLFVPFRRRWWTRGVRWLLPLRDEKGFALDALGEEVWGACDGRRSLEHVIEGFAERHRVRFHEARLSVLHFLRTLVERNLLALVVPGTAPASPAASGGGP